MRHWGNLSNIYRQLNNNKEAKKYIIKSLDLSVKICDVRGEVCNLINLGLIYFDEGGFDSAIEYFQQGLYKENKQYPKLRGHIFANLALANKSKGDFQTGKCFFDKAMAIYKRLDLQDSINELTISYGELEI
nr:tetratricopeptide repeat protein [Pseudoalteromonas sp. McH1-42]